MRFARVVPVTLHGRCGCVERLGALETKPDIFPPLRVLADRRPLPARRIALGDLGLEH